MSHRLNEGQPRCLLPLLQFLQCFCFSSDIVTGMLGSRDPLCISPTIRAVQSAKMKSIDAGAGRASSCFVPKGDHAPSSSSLDLAELCIGSWSCDERARPSTSYERCTRVVTHRLNLRSSLLQGAWTSRHGRRFHPSAFVCAVSWLHLLLWLGWHQKPTLTRPPLTWHYYPFARSNAAPCCLVLTPSPSDTRQQPWVNNLTRLHHGHTLRSVTAMTKTTMTARINIRRSSLVALVVIGPLERVGGGVSG